MKKLLTVICVGALFAGSQALPSAQEGGQGTSLEARVSSLEDALAAQKKANEETRALLEQAVQYIQAQAEASKGVLTTLDASEAAGFTKGINFGSREILLDGFRDYWGGAIEKVPMLPQKKEAQKSAGGKTDSTN